MRLQRATTVLLPNRKEHANEGSKGSHHRGDVDRRRGRQLRDRERRHRHREHDRRLDDRRRDGPERASAVRPPAERRDRSSPETRLRRSRAAQAKVPGGTIIRVETDADGHAKYEAHMTDARGNPVTVYVNDAFAVVGTGRPPKKRAGAGRLAPPLRVDSATRRGSPRRPSTGPSPGAAGRAATRRRSLARARTGAHEDQRVLVVDP